jgi:hypothetical protein
VATYTLIRREWSARRRDVQDSTHNPSCALRVVQWIHQFGTSRVQEGATSETAHTSLLPVYYIYNGYINSAQVECKMGRRPRQRTLRCFFCIHVIQWLRRFGTSTVQEGATCETAHTMLLVYTCNTMATSIRHEYSARGCNVRDSTHIVSCVVRVYDCYVHSA